MTDNIPALNVDAIKARAEAAQPGPWWWGGNVDHHGDVGLRGASTGHGVMDVMRTSPENVDEESAGKEWDTSDASDYIGRDEYIEMRTQNPQHHLCFLRADAMFVEPGRDVAIFEVARNQKLPDDTPRDHPKVYRGDVVGVRNPNADFIAHAREDIPALLAALAEQSQLRETAELELVEAHHHFGIQEGRITAAEVALTTAPADALEGARKAVLNGAPPMNAELTMTPDGPVEDRGMAAYVEGYRDAYVTLTAAIRAAATTEGAGQ